MESVQKLLSRVRSPRVHITYDVEIGDAIEQRELPLVVAILSDLSGKPKDSLPPIKERAFTEIDRDNFNTVMSGCKTRLAFKVDDVTKEVSPPKKTNLELLFNGIDDFSPSELVRGIAGTAELYVARSRLRDFLGKLDGNDALDTLLQSLWPIISPTPENMSAEDKKTKDTADKALKDNADALKKGLIELFGAVTDEISDADKKNFGLKEHIQTKITDFSNVTADDFVKSLLAEGGMARDDSQTSHALQLIGQFTVDVVSKNKDAKEAIASALINDRISHIDNLLSRQINLVLQVPEFQALEATWRGLHFLVMNTETSKQLKLRLLNVSKADLLKDLQKAVEFDQSALFKKVYEEEFGTYGGDPFSFMVGDYEFGRHPEDIELLEKISGVAASAHAPFITSAYAKLFDLKDFFSLAQPRDLSKIFESTELIKWRSFRDSDDSRYVTLALPKVLLRLPYGPETVRVEDFDFTEDVDGTDASKYLWGNAAYVLAQRITNAYAKYGWLAAIRGVEGGGLVEGLPAHTFKTPSGDVKLTCPTQVTISDRREKELNDLGFMAILHRKGSDKAAFFGGQTTNMPKKYNTDAANANARISSMLPYVLNASRFAHYIKVIMRDKIGSFATKDNASDFLNNWIASYVLVDDAAPQEMKASYPLRDARINVTDVPGSPGKYRATVFLRPHFQLEELSTSIRLVAELP